MFSGKLSVEKVTGLQCVLRSSYYTVTMMVKIFHGSSRIFVKIFPGCVVPENIHMHIKEGYWKFQGGGGLKKGKIFEGKYELKLEFPGRWGVQTQKTLFVSGATHSCKYEINQCKEGPLLILYYVHEKSRISGQFQMNAPANCKIPIFIYWVMQFNLSNF